MTLATVQAIKSAATKRLTLAAVRAELATKGIKISAKDGEFRVVPAGHGEADAYYTDDLFDALETGRANAQWLEDLASRRRLANR